MRLEIKSIKKDGKIVEPSNDVLPYEDEFRNILKDSLFENPLLEPDDFEKKEKLEKIEFKVEVISEGESLYNPKDSDFAGIDFIKYFENKSNPVILRLHLGVVLGLRPHLLKKIFGNPNQIEVEKVSYDANGVKRTLFHEFGHLLDALDPCFVYSNEEYKKIEDNNELHAIFESLWNCYLNRRLQSELKWKYPYEYGRPYLREAEAYLRSIWKSSKAYNFNELVSYSRQIQKEKYEA